MYDTIVFNKSTGKYLWLFTENEQFVGHEYEYSFAKSRTEICIVKAWFKFDYEISIEYQYLERILLSKGLLPEFLWHLTNDLGEQIVECDIDDSVVLKPASAWLRMKLDFNHQQIKREIQSSVRESSHKECVTTMDSLQKLIRDFLSIEFEIRIILYASVLIVLGLVAYFFSQPASYSECILKNSRGVNERFVMAAIRQACESEFPK